MRHLIFIIIFTLFIPILIAQIEISGNITDCEKNSLIGASIIEKKNNYAVSDLDGHYNLTVTDTNSVIKVSYMGFVTQKIKVGHQTTINVSLKEDEKLNEVEVIAYKPIIYLYPESEIDVSVQFKYTGQVLYTYPEYHNIWNVRALSNGVLINKSDNREYSYLFWEGKRTYKVEETKYSKGFVIAKDSVIQFLQNILPKIGLKPNEYNEFIVFWLPLLKANEWSFIYFRTAEEYNVISKNIVSPKPETEIRVFMEFKKIEKPFIVEPQLFNNPLRKGFTLVEWGGSQLKESISVKDKNGEYIAR